MEKDLEPSSCPPNCSKDYWKLMPLLTSINWPSLVASWVEVQKIYSKVYLVSCTDTHRDVTEFVNHGIVKNTKTWISWEQNTIFLQNKKILNLCLRRHILRSYHFVAEVTFNEGLPRISTPLWKLKIKWAPQALTQVNMVFEMGVNRTFDFRQVWKFCWDLSNLISCGNWLFRWDCVFSGGAL